MPEIHEAHFLVVDRGVVRPSPAARPLREAELNALNGIILQCARELATDGYIVAWGEAGNSFRTSLNTGRDGIQLRGVTARFNQAVQAAQLPYRIVEYPQPA